MAICKGAALCNGGEKLFLLALALSTSASAIAAVAILDSRFASRFLIVRIPFTQRAPSTKATGDESASSTLPVDTACNARQMQAQLRHSIFFNKI